MNIYCIGLVLASSLLGIIYPQQSAVYLFAHGLSCNEQQAYKYCSFKQNCWLLKEPLVTFNFPDATNGFNCSLTSLAQTNEIEALKNAYKSAKKKGECIILAGMSRGAATIITFAGTKSAKRLKAIIAESPFDSISNIIDYRLKQEHISWIPQFITQTAPKVVFNQYDPHGVFPITVVKNIRHDLPLLLVCSLEDLIIPAYSTVQLYLQLRDTGHEHVYLVLLNKGHHGALLWQDDGDTYLAIVHAFYQKYGLEHDSNHSSKGDLLLAQCQPAKEVVEKALEDNISYILY